MVGNSKIDRGAEVKEWREIMLAVAINAIRQKERIKINLKNLLIYFKRYLHRVFDKNGLKLFL